MPRPTSPPIIVSARDLLQRYDVLFCDVWGVLHDGHTAFPGAVRALTSFRRNGGTVVLVSNAPVPAYRVARMLEQRKVGPETYDEIVSSGAIALEHVTAQNYQSVYAIGPRDRDAAFMDQLTADIVPLPEAQAIVCTGLNNDRTETVADYAGVLEEGRDRGLPFVCANPDLVVDVGGQHFVCAGALGEAYAALGGEVYWAGKPHPSAYETALRKAQDLRQAEVPKSRILAIGDAIRTDLKSAEGAGVDALFVTAGIHRAETMTGAAIDPEKLAKALGPGTPPAIAATAFLDW